MFLLGVPEPCKTNQNLAHFEHFGSNRLENPFGPQFVGAYALKVETHVSQDPSVERSHDFVSERMIFPFPMLRTQISLELRP